MLAVLVVVVHLDVDEVEVPVDAIGELLSAATASFISRSVYLIIEQEVDDGVEEALRAVGIEADVGEVAEEAR